MALKTKNIQDKNLLNNTYVILVNPLYSGNVGAIARSMANFGLTKLVIVGSYSIDDEARCRAKHANFILDNALFVETFNDAKNLLDVVVGTSGVIGTDYNIPRSPLLADELVNNLKDYVGKIGLFFGPEDKGLSNHELNSCDFIVNIPCSDDYQVMNLSHAATIIFYEFFKNFKESTLRLNHVLASVKEKDVANKIILDILENMDFKAESDRETQKLVWRKVIGKSFITKREIFSVIGFFRNVDFVMKTNKEKNKKK